jgi:hypothetical protein
MPDNKMVRRKKYKVFRLSEHIKIIITIHLSRGKNNTVHILKFNQNIVETEEKSIPQAHIDDHSLV